MGLLVLVRHGQASLFSGDYDRLSELGWEQSRRLGAYWAARGYAFDRAFIGPRLRHRQTAEAVAEAYAASGLPFPDLELAAEKDEFAWEAIVAHAAGSLVERDERARELSDALARAPESGKRRAFEHFFGYVTDRWLHAAFEHPEVESFAAFSARIRRALDHMTGDASRGQRVLAFTSGGPAAIAVQRALDLTPAKAFELLHTLRNAALVEFLFSPGRFTLAAFNAAPHLDDPALWTHR